MTRWTIGLYGRTRGYSRMTADPMNQGTPYRGPCPGGITTLNLSVVLALVFLCAARTEGTTIGVIWSRDQGVVLAADSKTVGATSDGHSLSFTTCKIRQFDTVFFAASGVRTGPSFNIDEIAARSLIRPGRTQEKVERLRSALLQELPKVIAQTSPPGFPQGFQYVVAGIENGQPVVHILYLPTESKDAADLKWLSIPRDVPSDKRTATLFLGRHEVIDRFCAEHPGWESDGVIFDRLRELISMEIQAAPQFVGEPIDVLFIDTTGARWIGRTPASKCPDLGQGVGGSH
jgi:hypothetical protein